MKFGMLGYGRFGKLWHQVLSGFGEVKVYDRNLVDIELVNVNFFSLEETLDCDYLFLCVPISEFEQTCKDIRDKVNKNTVIIDVCSVKVLPAKIMQEVFGLSHPFIATHPLFGPDSVSKDGLAGKRIVVCNLNSSEDHLNKLEDIFKQMQLNIIHCSPEEHDEQMAKSQALIHFLGRAFAALELEEQEISTPDYQSFVRINDLVNNDTWQLFFDMQRFNPYAKEVRLRLVKALNDLENKISDSL